MASVLSTYRQFSLAGVVLKLIIIRSFSSPRQFWADLSSSLRSVISAVEQFSLIICEKWPFMETRDQAKPGLWGALWPSGRETRAQKKPGCPEKPELRETITQREQGSRKPGRRETRAQRDRGSGKSRPTETKAHGSKPGLRTSRVLREREAQRNLGSEKPGLRTSRAQKKQGSDRETRAQRNQGSEKPGLSETRA
jgi:hypothetical protein